MIGKQNPPVDDEENQSRIKLIADKRKTLEERFAQVSHTCYYFPANTGT